MKVNKITHVESIATKKKRNDRILFHSRRTKKQAVKKQK